MLFNKQNNSRKFQKFKRSSMSTWQSGPFDWKLCEFSFLWTNTIWQLATLFCRRNIIFQRDTIYHFHHHRQGSTYRWSELLDFRKRSGRPGPRTFRLRCVDSLSKDCNLKTEIFRNFQGNVLIADQPFFSMQSFSYFISYLENSFIDFTVARNCSLQKMSLLSQFLFRNLFYSLL